MVRLRPLLLSATIGLAAASSLMLASCGTHTAAQVRQAKIEAAARSLGIEAMKYARSEPLVALPMTQVNWHRQWIAKRPYWYHLHAAFWRWHLEVRRILGYRGHARQRLAETAYRIAIGQWFGDQVNKLSIVAQCVGYGPANAYSQKCWSTRRPRYQPKWIADDHKLQSAYVGMLRFNMSDFPKVIPNLCGDTQPSCPSSN